MATASIQKHNNQLQHVFTRATRGFIFGGLVGGLLKLVSCTLKKGGVRKLAEEDYASTGEMAVLYGTSTGVGAATTAMTHNRASGRLSSFLVLACHCFLKCRNIKDRKKRRHEQLTEIAQLTAGTGAGYAVAFALTPVGSFLGPFFITIYLPAYMASVRTKKVVKRALDKRYQTA